MDARAGSLWHKIFGETIPRSNPRHRGGPLWSRPPPLDYVTTNVPEYQEVYGEFSKQWHHAMNITKCEDPQSYFWTGVPLKHPTNSYYPPATVCATEVQGEFCPTSGESGSPLMVTDKRGRMVSVGINSFIKERFQKKVLKLF